MDRIRKWLLSRVAPFGDGIRSAITGGIIFITIYELIHNLIANNPWLTLFSVAYLFVGLTVALVFAVVKILRSIRKERYANIAGQIHRVMHNIRNLLNYMDQNNEGMRDRPDDFGPYSNMVQDMFVGILTDISGLFTAITGTICRVCIKTISFDADGRPFVVTMARDKSSQKKWSRKDRDRANDFRDRLEENSEFLRMMKLDHGTEGEWCFACNDIKQNYKFRSSSFKAYDPNYQWTTSVKGERYPLPYRSTVCGAIGQAPTDEVTTPGNRPLMVGFLSVDSESVGAFREPMDIDLIYAFADALFQPVRRYITVFNRVVKANRENKGA